MMHKLKPIALTVEGENTYKVRFQSDTGEVEYKFTIENNPVPLLVSEIEFLEIINGDPAFDRLRHSICHFHACRHFAYTPEEASKPADIRASRSDSDAAKSA